MTITPCSASVFTSDAQYQNLLAQRESRKGQIIAALHQTELLNESEDGGKLDDTITLALHRFVWIQE